MACNRAAWVLGGVLCGVLFDDVRPGDVGRHEVGRELDALELEVYDARERADHQCLREPRHTDEQTVPVRQYGHQELIDHPVLPDDRLPHLPENRIARACQCLDGFQISLPLVGQSAF
jgi:hypothetical protein